MKHQFQNNRHHCCILPERKSNLYELHRHTFIRISKFINIWHIFENNVSLESPWPNILSILKSNCCFLSQKTTMHWLIVFFLEYYGKLTNTGFASSWTFFVIWTISISVALCERRKIAVTIQIISVTLWEKSQISMVFSVVDQLNQLMVFKSLIVAYCQKEKVICMICILILL